MGKLNIILHLFKLRIKYFSFKLFDDATQEGCGKSGSGQEEGRLQRRKSQEEEVVQGKSPRQAQQSSPLRQGYVRQALQGSSFLQADHAISRVRETQSPRISRPIRSQGIGGKRTDQTDRKAPCSGDLHS